MDTTFLESHWLDITTTLLGLAYIFLEYKASIWLWLVGFIMQALGIVLYYQKGLYADCGMECYYIAMTIYGFVNWKFFKGNKNATSKQELPRHARHLGSHLVVARHSNQLHRARGRQFYYRTEFRGHLGPCTEIP